MKTVLNISKRLSGVFKACAGEANSSTMTVTPASLQWTHRLKLTPTAQANGHNTHYVK